jgi:hypothetical protein
MAIGVVPVAAALETAVLNLAITKLIPAFVGYSTESRLDDESAVREYIRTLIGNARNSLSTLRDSLRDGERMDDWKTLEGPLVKIDEFDAGLRTSLTGDAERKLKGTNEISKKHLEGLMVQDLRILEESKQVEAACQALLDTGNSVDSDALTKAAQAVSAKVNSVIALFKERRAIISGLPLSVVTGETKDSTSTARVFIGVAMATALLLGYAWKNGMLG